MKKVIIGDATLIHGDCLVEIPKLGECADLIVCDPPYKLSSGGAAPSGSIAEWHLAEDYNNDGSLVECNVDWPDFMTMFYNAMIGDSHCYAMANNRHVRGMLNAAELAKFRFHNLLTWDKGVCTPNRWYMKNCEFVGFFYKGKAKWINDMSSNQLIYCPQENYMKHPCSKPTALMEYLILNSSKEGETVLDPFMGVASTGIAALKSGRKFIGCEISDKWFAASVKRIEDFYNRPQQIQMI